MQQLQLSKLIFSFIIIYLLNHFIEFQQCDAKTKYSAVHIPYIKLTLHSFTEILVLNFILFILYFFWFSSRVWVLFSKPKL
jgi:hypothetical protein